MGQETPPSLLSPAPRADDEPPSRVNGASAPAVTNTTAPWHLLHSVMVLTRTARDLRAVAEPLLRTLCEGLGWSYGALVVWPTLPQRTWPEPLAEVPVEVGSAPGLPTDSIAALPRPSKSDGPRPLRAEHQAQPIVVVPLPAQRAGEAKALVFAGTTNLPTDWSDLLAVIAEECGHVVERQLADLRLDTLGERFQRVFEASPLAKALVIDGGFTFDAVNEALCTLSGYRREELMAVEPATLIHPEDRPLVTSLRFAALGAPLERHGVDVRIVRASGEVFYGRLTVTCLDDAPALPATVREAIGPTEVLLCQFEDLTSQRDAERALREQAEIDPLTGLANRFGLIRELDRIEREALPCTVIFMDLDGFKLINDTRGHEVGDEVLAEVAARIRELTGPGDFVARFGGDEFVVVSRPVGRGVGLHERWARSQRSPLATAATSPAVSESLRQSVRHTADDVQRALTRAIETSTGPVHIHTSIGIFDGSIPARVPSAALQRADTAMYQAKRLGKDRQVIYDAELHTRAIEHRKTDATLRNALSEKRFVLHYQPIVDTETATVRGFEALVRLIDGDGRLVEPGKFIAVAEQSGLIVPLGRWILREACRRISALRRELGRPLFVSVNVSARQAARHDLLDVVVGALADSGLPPSALTLELTESALLESDSTTLRRLTSLQQQGIHIALDDFGTGYSSLTYLQELPLSHIKVDRSFVSGITTSRSNNSIVHAVTWLAHEIGLQWIAEGVETREQWEALRQLGTGYAQGYLFNRPLPSHLLAYAVRAEGRIREADPVSSPR